MSKAEREALGLLHSYQRSPHSGAGNCVCGASERSGRHPHRFVPAHVNPEICTCTQPEDATIHLLGRMWGEARP